MQFERTDEPQSWTTRAQANLATFPCTVWLPPQHALHPLAWCLEGNIQAFILTSFKFNQINVFG